MHRYTIFHKGIVFTGVPLYILTPDYMHSTLYYALHTHTVNYTYWIKKYIQDVNKYLPLAKWLQIQKHRYY